MSVTFTTNLNLSKPSVGGSSNVWGGLINDDLDAVDAIFAAGGTGTSVGLKVGSGKTLDVSAGTLTLADNQISGDKVEGGTIAAITISSLTATSADINGGSIDGAAIGSSSVSTGAFSTISSTGAASLNSLVTSSADINGGAIDGTTVGASSASTGNFTSVKINNTNIFDLIYPVGSIYISTVNTSPTTLFGIGTWQALNSGVVLQTISSGTGGSYAGNSQKTITVTVNSTGSLPSHRHQWYDGTRSGSSHGIDFASSSSGHRSGSFNSSGTAVNFSADPDTSDFYTANASTSTITVYGTGSTQVNTTQEHFTVYMWYRQS